MCADSPLVDHPPQHFGELTCAAPSSQVDSNDPHARGLAGQFADDSQVDKFELTEEEYAARRGASPTARYPPPAPSQANPARASPSAFLCSGIFSTDTVLQYKKLNQLGRFAPSSPAPPPATVPADLLPGARCEVALSPELRRRGTVRFVGPTDFGAKDESTWVGVEWDEPVGKGDGACVLRSLFLCPSASPARQVGSLTRLASQRRRQALLPDGAPARIVCPARQGQGGRLPGARPVCRA